MAEAPVSRRLRFFVVRWWQSYAENAAWSFSVLDDLFNLGLPYLSTLAKNGGVFAFDGLEAAARRARQAAGHKDVLVLIPH